MGLPFLKDSPVGKTPSQAGRVSPLHTEPGTAGDWYAGVPWRGERIMEWEAKSTGQRVYSWDRGGMMDICKAGWAF